MTLLIILFTILYIIIGILVIMGYIFYQTKIKHEKINLDDEDGCIFIIALFWPLSAAAFMVWLICHGIFTFFEWFANSLQEEEKQNDNN